jgi:hypothetical protein
LNLDLLLANGGEDVKTTISEAVVGEYGFRKTITSSTTGSEVSLSVVVECALDLGQGEVRVVSKEQSNSSGNVGARGRI